MQKSIDLSHRIFNEDPYDKFAEMYEVPREIWVDMYHNRYLWYRYEFDILTEYFKLKTQKEISERTIRRWIERTSLYNKAQQAIGLGALEVMPEYFEGLNLQEFIK